MVANLLYLVALALVWPVVAYRMIRHGRYRRGVRQKLWGLSRTDARRLIGQTDASGCVWFHAVSVGEVNLLPGVVDHWKSHSENQRVVISSSTDTGYDLAVKLFGADSVFFCPLDFTWAVRRTLGHLRPAKLILAELELWPNLIRLARNEACEVAVINGRLSERSADRYQRFGALTNATFARLSWVGCQTETHRQRFADCGVPADNLSVTGSIKFDQAVLRRDTPEIQVIARWSGIDPWHRVWIVGSTQEGEEAMAINVYRRLSRQHPELRLVLVPRHRERFQEVAGLVTRSGWNVHRRSSDPSLFDSQWDQSTVLLVDTIGELRQWWGIASIATVGGTFGDRGGQNMLEPAGYGCPVSFGPDTRNFKEIAHQLVQRGGAVRVEDESELEAFVSRCLNDPPAADSLGRVAREVVMEHRGATERTIQTLQNETMRDETTVQAEAA